MGNAGNTLSSIFDPAQWVSDFENAVEGIFYDVIDNLESIFYDVIDNLEGVIDDAINGIIDGLNYVVDGLDFVAGAMYILFLNIEVIFQYIWCGFQKIAVLFTSPCLFFYFFDIQKQILYWLFEFLALCFNLQSAFDSVMSLIDEMDSLCVDLTGYSFLTWPDSILELCYGCAGVSGWTSFGTINDYSNLIPQIPHVNI